MSQQAAILHLVQSPDLSAVHACLDYCGGADILVLLGPAVSCAGTIDISGKAFSVFVSEMDASALGYLGAAAKRNLKLVSDEEIIRLTEQHLQCLSWK